MFLLELSFPLGPLDNKYGAQKDRRDIIIRRLPFASPNQKRRANCGLQIVPPTLVPFPFISAADTFQATYNRIRAEDTNQEHGPFRCIPVDLVQFLSLYLSPFLSLSLSIYLHFSLSLSPCYSSSTRAVGYCRRTDRQVKYYS